MTEEASATEAAPQDLLKTCGRSWAGMASAQPAPVPTIVTVAKTTPPVSNVAAWEAIVISGAWNGYNTVDLLKAYDHFHASSRGKANYATMEYEIARGLLKQLVRLYLVVVFEAIPLRRDLTESERDSARKTANAHIRAAIDRPQTAGGQALRLHFGGYAYLQAKEAKRVHFGRPERVKARARRLVSLDALSESDEAEGVALLERFGMVVDPRRALAFKGALLSALDDVKDAQMEVLILYTIMGFNAEELAPVMNCSSQTVRNRIRSFGRSPHMQALLKKVEDDG